MIAGISVNTVDGRPPTPPGMYKTLNNGIFSTSTGERRISSINSSMMGILSIKTSTSGSWLVSRLMIQPVSLCLPIDSRGSFQFWPYEVKTLPVRAVGFELHS